MVSSPITSWQIDGETMETVTDFLFLGSKITADGDYSHEIKRCLLIGRKAMTNLLLLCSHVQLFANPWTAACQSSLSFHNLLELAQTHVHQVGDAIQPSHPLSVLFPFQPSIFPSIRVFSNESVLHIRWPKFGVSVPASASVLPMNIWD